VRTRAAEDFLFKLPEVKAYENVGGLPLFAGLTQNGEFVLNRSWLFGWLFVRDQNKRTSDNPENKMSILHRDTMCVTNVFVWKWRPVDVYVNFETNVTWKKNGNWRVLGINLAVCTFSCGNLFLLFDT